MRVITLTYVSFLDGWFNNHNQTILNIIITNTLIELGDVSIIVPFLIVQDLIVFQIHTS